MNEILVEYFPGIGELANLHPLLVHFPIALFTGFLFAELLSLMSGSKELRIAGKWMLYLGTLGAFAAVIVGLQGAEGVYHEGEIHQTMSDHRDYGLNVLTLGLLLSTWRLIHNRDFTGFARIVQNTIGVLILVNLALGADLGAMMVYKYGVAVEAVPREQKSSHGHEHGRGIMEEVAEWIDGLTGSKHIQIREHSH